MVTPVASLLVTWPAFADSNGVYRELDPLLDKIAIGSSVICLNLGPDPRYRLWNPVVAMGHIVAVRGGRSLFDYSQSPTSPVTQRPEKQWPEIMDRLGSQPYNLLPDFDFHHFRYLVLRTTQLGLGQGIAMAIEKDATLIGQSGGWFLFESKLSVVPIDGPDAPLVGYEGPPLLKKLEDVVNAIGREGAQTPPKLDPPAAPPGAEAP
jgi:hypothetical protein